MLTFHYNLLESVHLVISSAVLTAYKLNIASYGGRRLNLIPNIHVALPWLILCNMLLQLALYQIIPDPIDLVLMSVNRTKNELFFLHFDSVIRDKIEGYRRQPYRMGSHTDYYILFSCLLCSCLVWNYHLDEIFIKSWKFINLEKIKFFKSLKKIKIFKKCALVQYCGPLVYIIFWDAHAIQFFWLLFFHLHFTGPWAIS